MPHPPPSTFTSIPASASTRLSPRPKILVNPLVSITLIAIPNLLAGGHGIGSVSTNDGGAGEEPKPFKWTYKGRPLEV